MTEYLIDLASYQAGLDLARPPVAAWNRVNIKTSQGNWYVANRARSRAWADQARALGKGISTFHWLDASTSGAEQARIAFAEMQALGGPDGMAHQCDCEDDEKRGRITRQLWADYVNAMQDLMGRHVINYTGDWWWTDRSRNWEGASLTPYLMASPNAGYLSGYPGDDSPHWNAGYGGWDTLAAMQFRVAPIPGGGPGADNVSMTAIRDPQVWAALTGGTTMTDPNGAYAWPRLDAIANLLDALTMGPEQGKAVPLVALLKDLRDNGRWVYPRLEALTHMLSEVGYGPEVGKPVELVAAIKNIEAALSTLAQPAPVAMTDADRVAIADLVMAKLQPLLPTAAQLADELAKRLGNG